MQRPATAAATELGHHGRSLARGRYVSPVQPACGWLCGWFMWPVASLVYSHTGHTPENVSREASGILPALLNIRTPCATVRSFAHFMRDKPDLCDVRSFAHFVREPAAEFNNPGRRQWPEPRATMFPAGACACAVSGRPAAG